MYMYGEQLYLGVNASCHFVYGYFKSIIGISSVHVPTLYCYLSSDTLFIKLFAPDIFGR